MKSPSLRPFHFPAAALRPPNRGPFRRLALVLSSCAALLISGAGPSDAVAQANPTGAEPTEASGPGVVFSLGGGIGTHGPAALVSLGIPVWKGEVILRGGGTADPGGVGTGEATGDVGALFGLRRAGTRMWARFAAGAGLVAQERKVPCDDFWGCTETVTGVGALGQVDGVWSFHRHFGIGISLHGAVGADDASYGAVSLGIFVGRPGLEAR